MADPCCGLLAEKTPCKTSCSLVAGAVSTATGGGSGFFSTSSRYSPNHCPSAISSTNSAVLSSALLDVSALFQSTSTNTIEAGLSTLQTTGAAVAPAQATMTNKQALTPRSNQTGESFSQTGESFIVSTPAGQRDFP